MLFVVNLTSCNMLKDVFGRNLFQENVNSHQYCQNKVLYCKHGNVIPILEIILKIRSFINFLFWKVLEYFCGYFMHYLTQLFAKKATYYKFQESPQKTRDVPAKMFFFSWFYDIMKTPKVSSYSSPSCTNPYIISLWTFMNIAFLENAFQI